MQRATHLELVCATSDKFYRVVDLPGAHNLVLTRWGRRGSRGQAQVRIGWSGELVAAKEQKGYDAVVEHVAVELPRSGWRAGEVDWALVEAADAAFETGAAEVWGAGVGAGGASVVVCLPELARYEHTPGFRAGLGSFLDTATCASSGGVFLAVVSSGHLGGMLGREHPLGPWHGDLVSVHTPTAGAIDAAGLQIAAGLYDQADEVGASVLAEALELAVLAAGNPV